MAIEQELRDRMDLELAGYRSAKFLGACAGWLFWDDNMDRAIKAGYFDRKDNRRDKSSYYYKLTSKGKAELRKVGPGFTYGDAQGRTDVSYRHGESFRTRWVKVSPKARHAEAERLLAAFKSLVTAVSAHDQLALEKKGWFPSKTTSPPSEFVEAGLIERVWQGVDAKTAYYRLTAKGKKVLIPASLTKLKTEHAVEIRHLRKKQAHELRLLRHADERRQLRQKQAAEVLRLPRETDVRAWRNFQV